MKQSGHLNPREETGPGCPVTSKYERLPPNKHGGVGQQGIFKLKTDPKWRGVTDVEIKATLV